MRREQQGYQNEEEFVAAGVEFQKRSNPEYLALLAKQQAFMAIEEEADRELDEVGQRNQTKLPWCSHFVIWDPA